MAPRLDLQAILKTIPQVKKVYFQEPENVAMEYPCIVYDLADIQPVFADNHPYAIFKQYQVTVISSNPDSSIVDAISLMRTARFDQRFKVDNLIHTVFNLFF